MEPPPDGGDQQVRIVAALRGMTASRDRPQPTGYLEFLSRGFNFFDPRDELLFEVIARGEFNISGFHNRRLRDHLPGFTSAQISRLLKRLRTHGLTQENRPWLQVLTMLGRQVTALGLRLKNLVIIPHVAAQPVA